MRKHINQASFIFHEERPDDPLNQFWTLGWKFGFQSGGFQYGTFITGDDAIRKGDELYLTILDELFVQALDTAFELGRIDANPFLRLSRWWKLRRFRRLSKKYPVRHEWDD